MAKAPAVKWTREHLLIALNLYCKLPFGSFDRDNRGCQRSRGKDGTNLQTVWR